MPSSCNPALIALLRGEPVPWSRFGSGPDELIEECAAQELTGLVYQRARHPIVSADWPTRFTGGVSGRARAQIAAEILCGEEVRDVLAGLMDAGVRPILIKGTSLAYSVYESPACRPRGDTDLLVKAEDVGAARAFFAGRGYGATVHCSDLFSQFEVQREDGLGVTHVFDVHWRISTQPVFADLLVYGEIDRSAVAVPALGPHARGLELVHALLLSCVHPVMHHQNVERVLWVYDVHLLASRCSPADFERLADTALHKRMGAVCASSLRRAHEMFGTAVPGAVLSRLSVTGEPSGAYLAPGRRWHDEFVSSLRGLASWRGRGRLLREVLFPSPGYMFSAYQLGGKAFAPLLLPALYLHRNMNGAWKILSGKK